MGPPSSFMLCRYICSFLSTLCVHFEHISSCILVAYGQVPHVTVSPEVSVNPQFQADKQNPKKSNILENGRGFKGNIVQAGEKF